MLSVGSGTATANVTDTVTPATVDLTASTVTEGSGASYVFTATLSDASQGVTTIHTDQGDISIADGATTGTLTIASGNGEDVYTDASSLTAHITGVSGGNFEHLVVGSGTATAQVNDTITDATVDLTASTVTEGAGASYVFTATLSDASQGVTTIHTDQGDISIADGATTGTLTIASGNGEDVYSDASSLTAHITGVSGGNFEHLVVGSGTATAQVNDTITDATVDLTASTVTEGAGASYVFTATLSDASQGVTTIHTDQGDISIADGATTGTLTIASGNGEDVYSDASSLTAHITGVSGGNFEHLVVGSGTATAQVNDTITDATVDLTASTVTEGAGASYVFTATLSDASQGVTTIHTDQGDISIADGATTGTLTIASGNGEDVYSDASSLTAHITGVSGGNFEHLVVGSGTATAQVNDTITDATVDLTASTVTEGAGASYVFTATLSDASQGVTTIHTDQGDISIADGATTGTLTIASGNGEDVYSDASSLTAHITGVSGGNFEHLVVGSGTATAQVNDTITTTTVALDDAVAGSAPGTATITAHVDHAVMGSDLLLSLSNGATVTIAVGATSGTSAEFAALADATISVTSTSGGNFEALDISGTALLPVNDAPVNTLPGVQTVAEDSDLAITGLSISDTDAGSANNITTTLSVAHGTLTVSSAGGAAVSGSGTGSVTLTGSIAEINTTLAAVNNVVYRGVADFNGSDALTITTNDQGNTGIDPGLSGTASSEQAADTVSITVTAVNDAPVATITPVSYAATEQVSLTLKNAGLSIADVDAGSGSMTVTLAVTEGTLNVTAGTSGAVVSNSGTSSVTITGTVAQVNALLNTNASSTVSYVDNTDTPSASSTLTLTVHDNGNTGTGGDLVSVATSTINITAVNDAPVATITPVSYAATEQVSLTLKNAGLSIADVDAGSGSMTVTLAVTEGTLNVTAGTSGAVVSNSGTSSVTITGTVAQVNALLNTNASSTVSYVDNTDTPSASSTLTLTVHDNGNTGTGGDLVSVATSTINITAVNDAPVATITPVSYAATEQVSLTLKNAGLSIADVDAGSGSMTVTLAVTEGTLNVTAGTSGAVVSNSGTSSVTITGTVAQVNALLNTNASSTVSYVDNTDTPSASSTLTLTVHDNGNTGTGGDLVSVATSTINITAVNDAPVATITPVSYAATEQVSLTLKNAGLSIADVDAGSGSMTVTLAVTEGTLNVTAGTSGAVVSNSGTSSVTITGTVAQVNALLNTNASSTVSYVDNTDTPSASSTLTLTVHDNGNTGTGGDLVSVATSTINITAVNDAPVATITPVSYAATEQVSLTLKNAGLSIADVDAGSGSMTVTLAVTEGTLNVTAGTSGAVVSNSGTSSVTITGTVAQVNALLNTNASSTVSYVDNTDTPSASSTLTLTVHDNGNTGTGGDLVSVATSTINITAVNDAPVATITPVSYAATEQVSLTLKNAGLSIADVDAGSGSMTVTLAVTEGTLNVTAGTSGAVVSNSGTSSVTITGTVAQVNALLNTNASSTVSYVDNTDTPSASSTLTLTVHDNGNTGTGGDLVSVATSTINITAVNDAPVATITPVSYAATEQVSLTLKNAGLSIADVDAGSGSMTVTLAVTEGTLNVTAGTSGAVVSNSGTSSVTITGTVAQVNALLNTNASSTVSYVDNTDTPSASSTLTLTVHDNGNTGTGGDLVSVATSTINITAVNDAPVATITPVSYAATEQVSLTLKNAGLSIADVDAGSGSMTVTLAVTEGTLNVTAGTSGAVVSNSGTSSVTITGTVAQVNALLNTNASSTVSYVDNTDTPSASSTLTLTVHDNGNTGTGGDLVSVATSTINITAVNDAPVATITPVSYAATEQVSLTLKNAGLSIADVDAGSGSMTVTLAVTEGTLNVTAGTSGAVVSNSGTSSVTITGTVAQVNALLEHQCLQHGQLRRQHRHPERLLDADPDRARQRQHRHRR